MKIIRLQHSYNASPERVWAVVTDYNALARVMDGIVTFEGLPDGRTETGQKIDVLVSVFGKLPAQPYHMEVILCDDAAMVLQSSERGAGVKSWTHRLSVQNTPSGCILTDEIEIDAGVLTPVFVMWARYLYRARHKPRLELLQSGVF